MSGLVRDPVIESLLALIHKLRPSHKWCDEDNWYSCPKAPDGCADDSRGPECDCGADQRNAEIDNTLRMLGLL